jgi:hypothetical protein
MTRIQTKEILGEKHVVVFSIYSKNFQLFHIYIICKCFLQILQSQLSMQKTEFSTGSVFLDTSMLIIGFKQ